MEIQREANGRVKKGSSLNISGRPKTSKLTQKDKNTFSKLLKKCVEKKDLSEAIYWLCEKAHDTIEIFKYLKEFAPYIMPKLSSTKTETTQIKQVKISFVSEEKPKIIEGEIVKKEIGNE